MPGPGLRTALADKRTTVLAAEEAESLTKKAEVEFEAELEAKLSLENKRNEKAFRNAMIASLHLVVCMKRPLLRNTWGRLSSPLMFLRDGEWRLVRQIILQHPC